MIGLFLIEDHLHLVLSSLRFMFRPGRDGIEISGSATTPDEAISNGVQKDFDIFILDLLLPGLSPIENVRKLKRHYPDKPIIIFTSEKTSGWSDKMKEEGVMAFVTKDSTREVIGTAIKKVMSGECFFMGVPPGHEELKEQDLNPVEFKITNLLSKGLTHKEIAIQIGVSRSMIEKILKRLRKKYSVNNNVELIKILTAKNYF